MAGQLVPAQLLNVYQAAAASCPGLPWTVLAAINEVESADGTSPLPGVRSGANFAGAEGPMQFEPATFAAYANPVPPGGANPPSPYDSTDAIYAAARDLCANGGAAAATIGAAVFAYNHSAAYVNQVLTLAASYGTEASAPAQAEALAAAQSQLGVTYVWGGETPGEAFDCSGLVQWAFGTAGVSLPRVAQAQYDAGPVLAPGAALQPGDLVFFGSSTTTIGHVGIYAGNGQMIDAPHTNSVVRLDSFTPSVGAAWGTDIYVGATAPGGG
jgi:cell wall-associated NlpC family hydrolase